jgi:hypothetical protein
MLLIICLCRARDAYEQAKKEKESQLNAGADIARDIAELEKQKTELKKSILLYAGIFLTSQVSIPARGSGNLPASSNCLIFKKHILYNFN